MGLCDLHRVLLRRKFAETETNRNEGDFSDNIKGDRQGSDKKKEDCQGIALVAEGEWNCV